MDLIDEEYITTLAGYKNRTVFSTKRVVLNTGSLIHKFSKDVYIHNMRFETDHLPTNIKSLSIMFELGDGDMWPIDKIYSREYSKTYSDIPFLGCFTFEGYRETISLARCCPECLDRDEYVDTLAINNVPFIWILKDGLPTPPDTDLFLVADLEIDPEINEDIVILYDEY